MYTSLIAAAALFTLTKAHGIVYTVTGGEETYQSPLINSGANPGPFYLVNTNSPVAGADNADLACGPIQAKATSNAKVSAGSTLQFTWNPGYSNNQAAGWPHNTGPVFFYMAKVADGADPDASTKWTKMAQYGMDDAGVWKQADLKANKPIAFTVPKDIKDGDYVIRAEPINLAIASPEFFPGCTRWTVTGGGSSDITTGKQVSFPGGYSASDPGLSISGSGVYQIHSASEYTFPGPAVFEGGSDNTPPAASGSASSPAATTSSAAGAPAATSSAAAGAPAASSSPAAGSPTTSKPAATGAPSSSAAAPANNGAGASSAVSSIGSVTPVATTSGAPQPSTIAAASCADEWTKCNAQYKGLAEDQKNYKCQTQFTECVAKEIQKNQAAAQPISGGNAKRMHRRRQATSF